MTLTKSVVQRGIGYSVLTFTATAEEVRRSELRALTIERPPICSIISLAILREQRASRLIRTMSEVVTEKLRELVVYRAWREQVTWLGDNVVASDKGAS